MPTARTPISAASFTIFGDLLRYLRTRERLTQRDLSIAVGYSEAQISRLEGNQRPPDLAAVTALLVPALDLRDEPEVVARLLELAAQARGATLPAHLTITRTVKREVHTQVGERAMGVTTLPVPRTSLVGRDRETEEVMRAISESRLVTLTGAGGSGKTRLSLHVAAQVAQSFADGVCFAAIHAAESSWCRAAQLLGAADALRQRIHTALLPIEHEARGELIAKIGDQLGASEFGSARTQGYALTLDDAMQIIS